MNSTSPMSLIFNFLLIDYILLFTFNENIINIHKNDIDYFLSFI